MKHFKLATTAAIVMGLGAAAAANADSGLITFTGSITDATCVVTGGPGTDGGQGNFIVALDPEPNTSFTAVGAVAGRHDFRVNVGPAAPGGTCGLEDGSTVASMSFGVGPNTNLSGRLDNILEGTAGSAEGFDLQIVDEAGTAIDLSTADAGLQQASVTDNVAHFIYGVQYFAAGADADRSAGSVRSNVIYNVSYN